MGVPHYNNLGDIAIAYAEFKYIKDMVQNMLIQLRKCLLIEVLEKFLIVKM